jgi:hypothetical protein
MRNVGLPQTGFIFIRATRTPAKISLKMIFT